VNKTRRRSSLLITLTRVDSPWLDDRWYTLTRRMVCLASVDRSVINYPITAICCTTCSDSCAAVDKISTDTARRAVPLRQQSFLLAHRIQSADLVILWTKFLFIRKWVFLLEPCPELLPIFFDSSPRYVDRRKRCQFSSVASRLLHWTFTFVSNITDILFNWTRCRRCVCVYFRYSPSVVSFVEYSVNANKVVITE